MQISPIQTNNQLINFFFMRQVENIYESQFNYKMNKFFISGKSNQFLFHY